MNLSLALALTTTITWGVWGVFVALPERNGFPTTLGYVVWSLTMLIPATAMLVPEKFQIDRDRRAIGYGILIGLVGCNPTVALFKVLTMGPSYLIFPVLSLAPVITVAMAFALLGERIGTLGAIGVVLALVSIVLFSIEEPTPGEREYSRYWLILTIGITAAWGAQAYWMKTTSNFMSSASVCFYTALVGIMMIPLAVWMTDFGQHIHWGLSGPGLAAAIHLLNAVGFCTMLLAFRSGKAVIVAPLCNVYPLVTVLVWSIWSRSLPGVPACIAIVTSLTAATLIVVDEQRSSTRRQPCADTEMAS
jgi:drug/metabolite transporter (DMT)-like permease